jgi:hypothetical protein
MVQLKTKINIIKGQKKIKEKDQFIVSTGWISRFYFNETIKN